MLRVLWESRLVVGSDYRAILFLVPPVDIESHLRSRDVGPDFLYGEIELVQSLYRWGRSVVRAAEQSPELFEENRHIREGVRRELIERLGETLSSTRDLPARDAELTRVNHSRLVKRTQDYALEHIDERIHLADLCHAMRVSERTLRYAFRNVLGMSPVAYLSRYAFIESTNPSTRRNARQPLSPRKRFGEASGTSAISRKRTKSVSGNCPPTPSRTNRSPLWAKVASGFQVIGHSAENWRLELVKFSTKYTPKRPVSW